MKNVYENYGDMNFFEYGRMIMDTDDGDYEILSCDFVNDADGDTYMFSHGLIAPNDSWIDLEAVRSYAGSDGTEGSELARTIFDYYGAAEFCGGEVEFLSSEEVQKRMEGFAEDWDFDSFPWRKGPLH